MWGWIVAAVVVVAAGTFYFWPTLMQAPSTTTEQTATTTSEQSQGSAQEQLSGNWKSNTDAKFTREMRADGVVIDRYEGDMSAGTNGSWSIVNPAQEAALASMAAALSGSTVVKVVWEGGVETTYFKVNSVSSAAMTITDLSGRGGVTVFTKI